MLKSAAHATEVVADEHYLPLIVYAALGRSEFLLEGLPLLEGPDDFPGLGPAELSYQAHFRELVDYAGRTCVSHLEGALQHGGGCTAGFQYQVACL